ncbi:MAG: hypothetical protein WBN28_08035 [Lutimonas sp.]
MAVFLSWLFGLLVFTIGLINTFWGNDPILGFTITILSFLYFPPISSWLENLTGVHIPRWVKIILGIIILWIALGVGELSKKIDMMMIDML